MSLPQLSTRQFRQFRDFIYERCGIRVDERKVALLSNRIRRRVKAGEFTDFAAYYRHLTSAAGVGEVEHFLDAVTTNETFFFRTPGHFDWLKAEFVEEMVATAGRERRPQRLRIWSAGCASGAEPYSIAICLAERAARLRDWSVSILGTDISEEALRLAREGAYPERVMTAVSETRRRRYFEPLPAGCRVAAKIRKAVRFENHNLMQPAGRSDYDCIWIRNVLIYFDRQSKQAVIDHLTAALRVGGYLVVGPSEGVYDMLGALVKRSPFLYQKTEDA